MRCAWFAAWAPRATVSKGKSTSGNWLRAEVLAAEAKLA
jgi:hypothetical protein